MADRSEHYCSQCNRYITGAGPYARHMNAKHKKQTEAVKRAREEKTLLPYEGPELVIPGGMPEKGVLDLFILNLERTLRWAKALRQRKW